MVIDRAGYRTFLAPDPGDAMLGALKVDRERADRRLHGVERTEFRQVGGVERKVLRLGIDTAVVGIARERCDGLLRTHRAEPLELTMLEWAVFLRRVPELVAACGEELGMCAEGSPCAERLQQITETLAMIGLESKRRSDAGLAMARRRFDLARDHALKQISEPKPAMSIRRQTRDDETCAS